MPNKRPTQDELLGWMKTLSNWGRWGPSDELGTLNFLSPGKTKAAIDLVREGATVSCSRPVKWDSAPNIRFQPQHFMVASGEPYRPGDRVTDRQVAMDYFGLVFHGHSITHLDSLAHFFWDGRMYNGHAASEVTTAEGAKKESIDLVRQGIVTRGVLVDVPYLRGAEWLERPDGVGFADLEAAEKKCGFTVEPGDVLLMRTGQLRRWNQQGPSNVSQSGTTGPLPEILPFLHSRGVAVMGSDTGNDVTPSDYPRFTNPVHQIGIVALGLWILDNADLEGLAEACRKRNRWEFLINVLPLRLTNTTGSPCNPVAVF
ncbi:MAG: cyclase family protein [Chloroflexi bacterium]|nr:cyclase family protein [Chloroflexota bacterium]